MRGGFWLRCTPNSAPRTVSRISVRNPIVEMDGDEMARLIWQEVKAKLVAPYLDLTIRYFDFSVRHRDETNDAVIAEALAALSTCHVGVKCPTITPDLARFREFNLKKLWKSPNATLRNRLGGAVFREPILLKGIPHLVPHWKQPILVARHAFGDQYNATEVSLPVAGTLELLFTPAGAAKDGTATPKRLAVAQVPEGGGVAMALSNTSASIRPFAEIVFEQALQRKLPVVLTTKNTILPQYDALFLDAFQRVFLDSGYKARFEQMRLTFEHRLVDDQVAQALKGSGGFLWACKNYDGDIASELVAQGFGSLGLMTSSIVSADKKTFVSEAAHGTVTRHFRELQRGKETSTNSTATIFAWSRALAHRGRLDDHAELIEFAEAMERATIRAVAEGHMTKDVAACIHGKNVGRAQYESTSTFIDSVEIILRQETAAIFAPTSGTAAVAKDSSAQPPKAKE